MTAQKHIEDVKYIQIKLASPEKIISEWSNGEVETHETINYRTLKPELGGLFCERIFGPQKDYECHCGKYKKSTYKGKRCEICGVDIISAKVRRQRKGHIKLEEPVVSPMYKKHIMTLLGCKMRDIDALMQYNAYIVTKSNNSQLPAGSITEEEDKLVEMKGIEYRSGTIGLYEYLKNYDIDKEIRGMEDEIIDIKKNIVSSKNGGGAAKNDDNLRKINAKLELLLNFRNSGNRPEWLVMTVIPVIPPDLRPLVQIGSGRFVVSGLNELYRKVIIRNNRLKEMKNVHAAELLLNDGRVALQRAVEELFDNSKNNESVSANNRNKKIQKSLVEMLKGKQGRFRQNLLGKRVDFSGRSVIVVGPNLKLDECGLPKKMALELFKPFVIADLLKSGKAFNIKFAKIKIENQEDDVWEALERVIQTKKVLLNRAPTLHRLGIQAFRPRIVEGKAIRLSPLVCSAYNADFDGDQMAVHLPLSDKAQQEATKLMLASNNILNPKDGQPIVAPSQDMILGNYYVSLEEKNTKVHIFKSEKEALLAFENRYITLQDRVFIKATGIEKGYLGEDIEDKLVFTTVGKTIFNKITPDDYHYINEANIENFNGIDPKYIVSMGTNLQEYLNAAPVNIPFKKGFLSDLIYDIFEKYDIPETSKMLDSMKDLGYKYSALSGISISFADVPTVEKQDILDEAQDKVDEWNALFGMGLITEEERYQRITQDIWPEAGERITDNLMETLDNTNNIFMMSDSGARGNRSNFKQLGAMRGLMAAPSGEIIELPVKSSFKEGLSVLEYFISSHGARKGLADTALKTADSGYLTRRLVDVAQDVVVTEEDCHTYDYNLVSDITEGTEVIEKLKDRIIGRFSAETIYTKDGDLIVEKDEMFSEAQAEEVIANDIKEVKLRTIFTCKSKQGVCQKCYGRDLSTNKLVNVGEAVGIVSAQSIGEPGTQLTMRTFHTGGVAGNDITQGLPRIVEILEARTPKGKAVIATETGELEVNEKSAGYEVIIKNGKEILSQEIIPHGYKIKYNSGDMVARGDLLTEGSVHTKELLEYKGVDEVRKYILKEIQKVYRLQGVGINDKHIEIIVSQMLKFIRVVDSGSTDLISGELLRYSQLVDANLGALVKGKDTAIAVPAVMGIKEASLKTESFLSAASFQETAKVLANATVRGKKDYLRGVKENVIVGKLIPAGTGKVDNYKGINDELIAAEAAAKLATELAEVETEVQA
ncbi:DNA-directed RNA polymerase subunit beta' [Mollicutes bacterium LVI A0078]|nr:DNA-directed RNA polymerase subunit beta' [Mollicutes bacterium LVI A0075]WOO91761.1 DNA-directed RNA polymerase subunit beta' [Mollicutes bacterium LVI A0078]